MQGYPGRTTHGVANGVLYGHVSAERRAVVHVGGFPVRAVRSADVVVVATQHLQCNAGVRTRPQKQRAGSGTHHRTLELSAFDGIVERYCKPRASLHVEPPVICGAESKGPTSASA